MCARSVIIFGTRWWCRKLPVFCLFFSSAPGRMCMEKRCNGGARGRGRSLRPRGGVGTWPKNWEKNFGTRPHATFFFGMCVRPPGMCVRPPPQIKIAISHTTDTSAHFKFFSAPTARRRADALATLLFGPGAPWCPLAGKRPENGSPKWSGPLRDWAPNSAMAADRRLINR